MSVFLALVDNYTDRPDLLIAEIEKHDPGFIKRFMASAEAHSSQLRDGKFNFGKRQAYTALAIRAVAAVSFLLLMALAVQKDAGFWTIIALVIGFAVSQDGASGFSTITKAVADAIQKRRDGEDNR